MPASLPTGSQPVSAVYTKAAWADSWTERPLAIALQLSDQAAPAHPSASILYRYGQAMLPEIGSRPADSALTTIGRGGLIGHYVKIEVDGLGDWYGVLIDSEDTRGGLLNGSIPTGMETYQAFGLTWFLDQIPLLKSKVKYPGGSWEIDRAIPFNGGTEPDSKDRRENKVAWKNFDSTLKCFTDRSQTPTPSAWKAKDALEYLIENYAPKDASGAELLPFALHASATTFLDYELGFISYEGRTLWSIINSLIDRRRGLGWNLIVDSGTLKVKVWSQNKTDITLPSGSTIPANPSQTAYNFETAVNIRDAKVTTSLMTRYDQVICRGERAGSVFSIRPQTNFEKDWTDDDKTKYNKAASELTGYGSLSDADKEAANNDFRSQDNLARVFSWWRPKSSWNGRSATHPVNASAPFALPKIDEDGLLDTEAAANIQRAGLRVQSYVPMRQNVDYTKPIVPELDNDDADDTDYLAPMVWFQLSALRAAPDEGWVHAERLNQSIESNSSKRQQTYSVDVAVREDAPGLILRTVGRPQHYIAQDLYTANSSFEAIASGEGINSDKWLATVYMLQDAYALGVYPKKDDLPSLDLIRPLLLSIPGAHVDWIVAGTVVAVAGGELKKTLNGGFLRDDRKKLNDIARMAFAWYGQQRRILNLSFSGITTGFDVGTLITDIGTGATLEEINTCITCVTYDLIGNRTTLHTQFGELDFTK